MEAIILAGGFGTRLRQVISDIPKPMAPIKGKPFLVYILDHLQNQGIKGVILSTGYKHKIIEDYFGSNYKDIALFYSVEDEPLGTGGAIKKALEYITGDNVFILNGDSFFGVNLKELYQTHLDLNSDLTLALKPMKNSGRYGIIETSGFKVVQFKEKSIIRNGDVNGGIYAIKSTIFKGLNLPDKFSLERDFMEKHVEDLHFNAYRSDAYFIDIGIPEDYLNAQRELPKQL